MKSFIFIGCILVCYSCIKEKQTFSYLKPYNNTGHTITIIPYSNGVKNESQKKILSPDSVAELEYNFTRGITSVPIIFFNYIRNVDSIHVLFDNQYQITHLLVNASSSLKSYPLSSQRNFGNKNSYQDEKTVDKKLTRTWEVKYTFTQQDYLDAQ